MSDVEPLPYLSLRRRPRIEWPNAARVALWVAPNVEVYELLTDVRGWTRPQYERWLAGIIDRLLPERDRDT